MTEGHSVQSGRGEIRIVVSVKALWAPTKVGVPRESKRFLDMSQYFSNKFIRNQRSEPG